MVHESNAPAALPSSRPDRAGERAGERESHPLPARPEQPALRWPEDVIHVRWPADSARRAELARLGRPRLLHVETGVEPPAVLDELEDWVRTPADAIEVVVRATTVSERYRVAASLGERPVDEGGVLRVGSRWVALSPAEAVVARALDGHPGVPLATEATSATRRGSRAGPRSTTCRRASPVTRSPTWPSGPSSATPPRAWWSRWRRSRPSSARRCWR